MKVNRLETHDRLIQFGDQADLISKGCTDCINGRPTEFGNHPFYIFAHHRELDIDERIAMMNMDIYESATNPLLLRKYLRLKDVPTARLIWSPRLTKPTAQTNSMLFKAYPPTDNIKIIWIIPDRGQWPSYQKGNMLENQTVTESIHNFEHNRADLEARESDDLPDYQADDIYRQIALNKKTKRII